MVRIASNKKSSAEDKIDIGSLETMNKTSQTMSNKKKQKKRDRDQRNTYYDTCKEQN